MKWRTDVFGERNAAGGARSEGLADYRVYVLTGRQKALCMLLGGAALFAVGCVFFIPSRWL
ncbi:hypothetical protein HMSSN036_97180 [Paenibacillus macerans]|nr:hypothetical protein HMSSN036_97180 [Paenibacillus macerans]